MIYIYIYIYLTATGLTPSGSSTVHIYTQKVHRIQRTEHTSKQTKMPSNLGSAGRVPSLRVAPWHLSYSWGKSTEKPQLTTVKAESGIWLTFRKLRGIKKLWLWHWSWYFFGCESLYKMFRKKSLLSWRRQKLYPKRWQHSATQKQAEHLPDASHSLCHKIDNRFQYRKKMISQITG
jgi:hypothetical protein